MTMLRHAAIPALAAGSLLLAACGGGSDNAGAGAARAAAPSNAPGAPGRGITIAVGEDPGTMDPAAGSGVAAFAHQLIYDPLVHLDRDGKVVGGLATSWKGDAQQLTFTLRKGVTCADGSPVTPSLVARNFKRMEDPALPLANLRLTTNKFDLKADDQRGTFTLRLDRPNSFLLQSLARIYIVCPAGLRDDKLLTAKGSGSGPYVLKSAKPNDRYVFERRDGYRWGPDGASTGAAGMPQTVTVRVIANETTSANLLLGGQIDVGVFQGTEATRVRAAGTGRLETAVRKTRTESLLYNEAPGRRLQSPEVRKALTMVLDRPSFAKVLTSDFGGAATGVAGTEPLACGYDVTSALPKGTVEDAKGILDAAGWTPGAGGVRQKDGRKLELQAIFPPAESAAFEYLQETWKQLGVALVLNPQPTASIDQKLIGRGNWDVTALYPGSSFPSAVDVLVSGPTPPKGTNIAAIDNPGYDRLSAAAKKLAGEAGCDAWSKAEATLYERAELVPMAQRQALWAWRTGVSVSPQGSLNLYIPTALRSPAE